MVQVLREDPERGIKRGTQYMIVFEISKMFPGSF